jgi:DinB superfamily
MTTSPTRPEVWQRGPVAGVDALLMPVAHALLQVQEDLEGLVSRVPADQIWIRPGGAGSIAFHVRHIGGSIDRLLTYARGENLTAAQRMALAEEDLENDPRPSLEAIVAGVTQILDRALVQVRATPRDTLLEPRKIGRAGLPTTTLGLLFHAAEHATRHAGQAITTAKILTAG